MFIRLREKSLYSQIMANKLKKKANTAQVKFTISLRFQTATDSVSFFKPLF